MEPDENVLETDFLEVQQEAPKQFQLMLPDHASEAKRVAEQLEEFAGRLEKYSNAYYQIQQAANSVRSAIGHLLK